MRAKLILYASLSLVCISNRNQRCVRKKPSSQRLQRLFPILHEKGSFYSRTAIRLASHAGVREEIPAPLKTPAWEATIRSKQTDYANFQKKKKRVYTICIFKEKKLRKRRTWNTLSSFLHDVKSSNLHQKPRKNRSQRKLEL